MPATILVRAVGVVGGRPGNPLQRGRLNSVNYHFVTGAALKIVDSTARQTLWGRVGGVREMLAWLGLNSLH